MPQRQFNISGVASGGRSLVAHQRQQSLELRTRHPQRLEAVTQTPGPPRGRLTVATDVHRKMLAGNRFWAADDVVELKECIVVRQDRASIPLRGSCKNNASAGYGGAAYVGYSSADTSRLRLRRN